MSKLQLIKKPVSSELKEFEIQFREAMKSNVSLLDIIMRHIVKQKGKQIRPLFVFLSAGMNGNITPKTYRAAIMTELLHTATLIHDDVVDHSHFRRGFFSVNGLWGNKVAVLVGDYLLATGLSVTMEHNDFDILKIVTSAVQSMSKGELLQIQKARKLDIDEAVYFEIIRQKTASLIASCCATGAASAGATASIIESFWKLGEHAGTLFQLRDDLFEFEQCLETGKPKGLDLQERKLTLPIIYALNKSGRAEKALIINTIKRHNTNTEKINQLLKLVEEKGGIKYARSKMDDYESSARELLFKIPDSVYKNSFLDLLSFIRTRSL